MFNSPLLFPVKLKEGKISVLDETALPFREDYIEVKSLDNALRVLKDMKTRAFGQVLLFFYACVLFRDYSIDDIAARFKEARPTFDFFLLRDILKKESQGVSDIGVVVDRFIKDFDGLRRGRARRLAKLLPQEPKILTICNVNGELGYLYEELENLDKHALFYVSETRPYLQGTRLTFWELRKNNIPAYLICDNQAARLMKEGKVNCVLSGADRATKGGDIVNKVGTYALALLAKHFGIPFYALIQYPKDIHIKDVKIEERPQEEVFMFLEGDFQNMEAIYPSFDVVEDTLITKPITLLNDEIRAS